jgi:uncharacterized membrane protein
LGLIALSYLLRSQALAAKFWIDEGLAVGIAQHPLTDIPSVLREDGAPPLYYLLLHVWIDLIGGDGETRTHAFSLLCALLTIPAGWYAGRRLFGTASAWATAALLATLPFLTYYAQETRMYALAVLIGLLASASFTAVFALRQRSLLPAFVVFGALVAYTHNWGLFLLFGCGVAWLTLVAIAEQPVRRALVRDGLIGFGLIVLLYAPWLPTLLDQVGSTGAPWAERPTVEAIVNILELTLGGTGTGLAIALVGSIGLTRMRKTEPDRARAALALLIVLVVTVIVAWVASQISPAWSGRYVAVAIGPALLLAGAGLVRARTVGLITLGIVLVLWWNPQESQIKSKSNVYRVSRVLENRNLIRPGDMVVSIHPEQGPVMRYYLGEGYRWADALGLVEDPQVFDWRHATDRLGAAKPGEVLDELTTQLDEGERMLVIQPIIRSGRWGAPWTELVRQRAGEWQRALDASPDLCKLAQVPEFGYRHLPKGVRAVVYERC